LCERPVDGPTKLLLASLLRPKLTELRCGHLLFSISQLTLVLFDLLML
jgi:hypothetical protein